VNVLNDLLLNCACITIVLSANPVVKYNGNMHRDRLVSLKNSSGKADLTIVVGTSLIGVEADEVALLPASRSTKGSSLGMVIINLQQTAQDGHSSLRIFGKADPVFKMLLGKLNYTSNFLESAAKFTFTHSQQNLLQRFGSCPSKVLVPYDREGNLLKSPETEKWMWLDLRRGMQIQITSGHNIQGARQPAFMHIGDTDKKAAGRVQCRDDLVCAFILRIENTRMRLGIWWLQSAVRGALTKLPIVNLNPEFDSRDGNGKCSTALKVLVPYNRHGKLVKNRDKGNWMWLDLRKGKQIKLTQYINVNGTRLPAFMNIEAGSTNTANCESLPALKQLRGQVVGHDDGFLLEIGNNQIHLGLMWLQSAQDGAFPTLPFVNVDPKFGDPNKIVSRRQRSKPK